VARDILCKVVVVVGRLAGGHRHRLWRRRRRGGGGREGVGDGCVLCGGMWLSLALAGCVLVCTLKYLARQLKIHGNICVTNTAAKKMSKSIRSFWNKSKKRNKTIWPV
jgi:hypothetical protein